MRICFTTEGVKLSRHKEEIYSKLTRPSSRTSIVVFCDESARSFELFILSHDEFRSDFFSICTQQQLPQQHRLCEIDLFRRNKNAIKKQTPINIDARKIITNNENINIKLVFSMLNFLKEIVSFNE